MLPAHSVLLPPSTFQKAFVDWSSAQTDAPYDFGLGVAQGVLAGALGANVWIDSNGRRHYAHCWICCVGESTLVRKSTVLGHGRSLLEHAVPEVLGADEYSREAFLASLERKPVQTLSINEMAAWLGPMQRDYNLGYRANLADIFDGPATFRRELRGSSTTVIGPIVVNVITATTPELLEQVIQDGDVAGGFLARMTWWAGRERPRRKDYVPPVHEDLTRPLRETLKVVRAWQPHSLRLSSDAVRLYAEANAELEYEMGHVPHSRQARAAKGRLSTYILKFAMLYQVGRDAPKGIETHGVESWAMESAIALVERLADGVERFFDEELATTAYGRAARKVRELIGQNGGIDLNALTRRTQGMDRSMRRKIIEDLLEGGDYERVAEPTGGRPRSLLRRRSFVTRGRDERVDE